MNGYIYIIIYNGYMNMMVTNMSQTYIYMVYIDIYVYISWEMKDAVYNTDEMLNCKQEYWLQVYELVILQ